MLPIHQHRERYPNAFKKAGACLPVLYLKGQRASKGITKMLRDVLRLGEITWDLQRIAEANSTLST